MAFIVSSMRILYTTHNAHDFWLVKGGTFDDISYSLLGYQVLLGAQIWRKIWGVWLVQDELPQGTIYENNNARYIAYSWPASLDCHIQAYLMFINVYMAVATNVAAFLHLTLPSTLSCLHLQRRQTSFTNAKWSSWLNHYIPSNLSGGGHT